MSNLTIKYIQHLILSIKSGRSILEAQKTFPQKHSVFNTKKQSTSIEYELSLLIQKGLAGFPILKLLERLQRKAQNQLLLEVEKHSRKTPFLALIPLFLFQVPSLILIFLYPMISDFIKELS